ncbi:MAG: alpha/beta fold hydrolase [Arcanobacterium sp.]
MDKISAPSPDYLGDSWVARTIFLTQFDAGTPKGREDVAVLVSENDADAFVAEHGLAALWLPGFIDSFFHVDYAAAWRDAGVALYGLDLRRGGRALRVKNRRDDQRDLLLREEEILVAVEHLRSVGAKKIVLIGHSTGGLQAVLFADRHPGAVDAIILNSPWLEHNGPDFHKKQLTTLMMHLGKLLPTLPISKLGVDYGRELHVDYGGEFFFNTEHKPIAPEPVFAGFFRAARIGHRMVGEGLDIREPVLVAHSDASGDVHNPSAEELASTDVVLNVEDMKRLGPTLGRDVTLLEVSGGRHDLALSQRPAREFFMRESIAWALDALGK